MRSLSKLVNYFTSVYSNSPKFNNSLYHFLKLFYERSAKSHKSHSLLGNVFKNSKWTNYKIQNIKISFLNSFIRISLLSFVLLLFIITYKQNVLLLVELLYNTIYLLIRDILYDYVNLSISTVLVLIYFFKTYIVNYYIYLLSPFKKNDFKKGKPTKLRSKRKKLRTSDSASTLSYYKNSNKIDANHHNTISSIFKIKNQLYWLTKTNNNLYSSLTNAFHLNSKLILLNNHKSHNLNYIYNLKSRSNSVGLNLTKTENLNISTNVNYNKHISKKFYDVTTFDTILNSSLNILKQTRWLTKNLLVSDKFILHTNFFTEYKKIVGTNTTLSNLSNVNVWASSNITKNANTQRIIPALYHSKNLNFNNAQLINNFDESRLWLFKKIYFNTIIRNADVVTAFNNKSNYNNTTSYNNNLLHSDFIKKSISYNLLFLDNTIGSKKTLDLNSFSGISNSGFTYNVLDYNLLTDDNIDNLINSFIVNTNNLDSFNFYHNVYPVNRFDILDINLKYIN